MKQQVVFPDSPLLKRKGRGEGEGEEEDGEGEGEDGLKQQVV